MSKARHLLELILAFKSYSQHCSIIFTIDSGNYEVQFLSKGKFFLSKFIRIRVGVSSAHALFSVNTSYINIPCSFFILFFIINIKSNNYVFLRFKCSLYKRPAISFKCSNAVYSTFSAGVSSSKGHCSILCFFFIFKDL